MAAAPQQRREFDILVFGATGFTGAKVIEEVLAKATQAGLSVAAAGRDAAKLLALKQRLPGGGALGIIPGVDIKDEASVARMARAGRLLLNCVGPYRFYGEPVFKAAAEAGTDYLDLCGEPQFIESMELEYGPVARSSGALMACASAFDSIPNDLGTILVAREFKPPAVPSAVDSVIRVRAPKGLPIHFATWEAAVHGIGAAASLSALRKKARAAGLGRAPALVGPRPKQAQGPVWDKERGCYTLPFPGADASIVKRTQSALSAAGEPAVHFTARFGVPTAYYAALAVAVGGTLMTLAKQEWGRGLLLKYPGLFSAGLVSHAGPTQEQMEAATCELSMVAMGYSAGPPVSGDAGPDKRVTLTISMGDPGYLFTAKMMAAAALALLQERGAALASVGGSGGVYTAGFLLRNTSIKQRLEREGMAFAFVHEDIPAAAVAAHGPAQ